MSEACRLVLLSVAHVARLLDRSRHTVRAIDSWRLRIEVASPAVAECTS